MAKRRQRRIVGRTGPRTQPGLAPGTILVDPSAPRPRVRTLAYGHDGIEEGEVADLEDLRTLVGRWPVLWVSVAGLGDEDTLRRLGDVFALHDLSMEDVANVHQRAKVEDYGRYLFFVARVPVGGAPLRTRQFSMFLGRNFVLSFEEEAGTLFDAVRHRLRTERGRFRSDGADYLAYALLDAVVDHHLVHLETFGEQLEALEDDVLANPKPHMIHQIHETRRDLLTLRRAIWPLREALSTVLRDVHGLIDEETRIYIRDAHDHAVRCLDLLETHRELAASLSDLYLSSASNRMNDVMRILTVIATIFIPLTFISSIYGMNFDAKASPLNMPELGWYWGYPAAMGLMAAVAVGLLVFFRRKGWLGTTWSLAPGRAAETVAAEEKGEGDANSGAD